MHAVITTWGIDPTIQDPEPFAAFIARTMPHIVDVMGDVAWVDTTVIRMSRGTMRTVSLFADDASATAGQRKTGLLRPAIGGLIWILDTTHGPAQRVTAEAGLAPA